MDAGGTAVLVATASFAVDRIVSLALYGLSLPKSWRRTFPDPDRLKGETEKEKEEKRDAERVRKTWYFLFATILTVPIVIYRDIRIFDLLGIPGAGAVQRLLDVLLTTLIFVAGADRLADLLKKHSTPLEKPREGIEVFGSLTIDGEKREAASVKCPACTAVVEAGSTYCGHCGARLALAAKAS